MSFRLSIIPLSDRTDNKPYDGEILVDNIYGDISIANNDKFESSTKKIKSDIQGMKINSKNVNEKIYKLIKKLGNYKTDKELNEMDRNNLDIDDQILGSLQFIKNTYLNSDKEIIINDKEKEYQDLYNKIYVNNSDLGNETQQSLSLQDILKNQLYEIIKLNGFMSEDDVYNTLLKIKKDLFIEKNNQLQKLKRKNEELEYLNKLIADLIGDQNNNGEKILEKQTESIIYRYNNAKNETKNRKFLTSKIDYFASEKIGEDSIFHFNNVKINSNYDIYTCFNRKYFNSMDEDNFVNYYNDNLISNNFDGNDNLYISDSKFNIRENENEQNDTTYINNINSNFNFSGWYDYKNANNLNTYNLINNNLYAKDNNNNYIYKNKILFENKIISEMKNISEGINIIPEIPLLNNPNYYKHMSENVVFDYYYNKNIFQLLNTNHYNSNTYFSSPILLSYFDIENSKYDINRNIKGSVILNKIIIPRNDWSTFYYYKNIEPYSFIINKIMKDKNDIFSFYKKIKNDIKFGISPVFTIFKDNDFIYYIDKAGYLKTPTKLSRPINGSSKNYLSSLVNINFNGDLYSYLNSVNDDNNNEEFLFYKNINKFQSHYIENKTDKTDNIINYYNKAFITNEYYTGFTPEEILSKTNILDDSHNFNSSEIIKDLGFKEYLNIFKYHLINIKSVMESLTYYDKNANKSLDFYFPDMLPFITFDKNYQLISILPNYRTDIIGERSNLTKGYTKFSIYNNKMQRGAPIIGQIRTENNDSGIYHTYSCFNYSKVKWYDEIIRFLSGNRETDTDGIRYLSYSIIEKGTDEFYKIENTTGLYLPKAEGELRNPNSKQTITNNKIDINLDFNILYKNNDETNEKEFLSETDNFELNENNFRNNYAINNSNYNDFIKKGEN